MSVNTYANSAFDHANSAFSTANSAFTEADSAASYANGGFAVANSSASYANSAFLVANNSLGIDTTQNTNITNAGTYANSGFAVANSASSYANSGFATANTANASINNKTTINTLSFLSAPSANTQNTIFLVVDLESGTATTKKMSLSVLTDRSANSAGVYANSAFAAANSAAGAASASSYANSAFLSANTPSHVANSAASYANSSFLTANTPSHVANSAASYANSAFGAANSASSASASSYANSGFEVANSAASYANSAFTSANLISGVDTTQNTDIISAASYANSGFTFANTAANLALSFGATTILEVTNNGSAAYRFSQYGVLDNPNVSTFSATTLGFKLNVTGHPFHIRLGDNTADYNTGLVHVSTTGALSYDLDAQGQVSGTLFWRIPSTSVGNYKYRCSAHPGAMIGEINVANTAGIYLAYNT